MAVAKEPRGSEFDGLAGALECGRSEYLRPRRGAAQQPAGPAL